MPELRIPDAAAQTRIVSKARIRLDSRKSVRSFKEIICVDISEFKSSHPSHTVGLCGPCLGCGIMRNSGSAANAGIEQRLARFRQINQDHAVGLQMLARVTIRGYRVGWCDLPDTRAWDVVA